MYSSVKTAVEIQDEVDARARFTHEVAREAKGKGVAVGEHRVSGGLDKERDARRDDQERGRQEWRPREAASLTRPVSSAPRV